MSDRTTAPSVLWTVLMLLTTILSVGCFTLGGSIWFLALAAGALVLLLLSNGEPLT